MEILVDRVGELLNRRLREIEDDDIEIFKKVAKETALEVYSDITRVPGLIIEVEDNESLDSYDVTIWADQN